MKFRASFLTVKLDANMEAVTLRQSVQWHTKVLTKPGPDVGCGNDLLILILIRVSKLQLTKAICTAPQKQVTVASSSLDQPSPARPARGKEAVGLSDWSAIA